MKYKILCSLLCLLVWKITYIQSRKINDDLVYEHSAAVGQRLSEVRQVLVPLPEGQWDQLLHHLSTLLVPVNAASDMCRNHSLHLLHSFLDQEIWALRMIDASSKLQSGLLDGNFFNLGDYAQCVSVEEPTKMFQGQHCVIETTGILPPEIYDKIGQKDCKLCMDQEISFSLCVPSSCSDYDINTHVDHSLAALGVRSKHVLSIYNLSTDIKKISCTTAEGVPFRTKDYCAMVVFASLAVVILIATLSGVQSGWLLSFSLNHNFRELLDTRTGPGDITCLRGLRVLLILLVIIAHRLFDILLFPSNRFFTILKIFDTVPMNILDLTMTKSVDVFFLIGGTLLSYNFFTKIKKREDFNFILFCIRRYFRVTPALAVVALYHGTLLVHSAQGPLWVRSVALLEDSCHKGWWGTLLHISNLGIPRTRTACVNESWYVACDFQLQCFAPIVLILLLSSPRAGLTVASLCLLLSSAGFTILAFYLQLSSGYWVFVPFRDRITDILIPLLYKTPVFRLVTFFIGLGLGYTILYCRKNKPSFIKSKWTAWLGWTLSASTMAGLMLINTELVSPDHKYMSPLDPLFVGVSRPLYCVCFAWLIFACDFGLGGPVNSFLSWPGFQPLAKLTYSVFLVHGTLQFLQQWSVEAPIIFSYTDQIFLYMGDVVVSFSVAAVLYATVELPFYKLANHVIKAVERRIKKKKSKKT